MITEAEALDAIPPSGFVRSYVEYAMDRTDCNAAYHIAAAVSILTQCVPLSYSVPYGNPLWGNMFSLIVGPSGHRKTSAVTIAQRLLNDALPGSVGETPGSQEGMYDSLREASRQLVCYGEFGDFLAKAEEGYMLPMKAAFTNLWDGNPVGRATAKKRNGPVEKPRLSLLCAVATDLLERHTEQADWTGGFLARFLTLYGSQEREFGDQPLDNPSQRRQLLEWVQSLAQVQPIGECLWLTDEGKAMWRDWYESLRPFREGANKRAAAAAARSSAIAAKLALLLAWDVGSARSGEAWWVGETELVSALKITTLHVRSAIELGENVSGSRDMKDRRSVLLAIGDQPTPTGVVIRRAELLKRRTQEILDSLLEERAIDAVSVNGVLCYYRTPQRHEALIGLGDKALDVAKPDNVLRLPVRAAAVAPEHVAATRYKLPDGESFDDEDVDWRVQDP